MPFFVVSMSNRFTKAERICSKREVDELFRTGKFSSQGILKFRMLEVDSSDWPKAKFLVIVPKRSVKKAVDRNKVKRRLREVIRLNKNEMVQQYQSHSNKRVLLAVLYMGQGIPQYHLLEKSFKDWIEKQWPQINKN